MRNTIHVAEALCNRHAAGFPSVVSLVLVTQARPMSSHTHDFKRHRE